ncbi:Long chronological lifespan protein 2 [Recurvomyces mirabilis]|nr:Long chronological lifespan protein 2 [Recurvomyces mirabilis]
MEFLNLLLCFLLLALPATAQFQFFEHMFGGQQQQQQSPQNAGSDSAWYQQQYEAGGWAAGESARKVELARKGLL